MSRDTYTHVIHESCLHVVVAHLLHSSVWFAVTPLPDSEWEITIKQGDRHVLQRTTALCL